MAYPKTIALDFDGTCVQNAYPKIGEDIGAAPLLLHLQKTYNIQYMLWTMRTGEQLEEAKAWFKENRVGIWATNNNPKQARWSSSPKCYANLYIDDTALGVPLAFAAGKNYVDWSEVAPILEDWCMQTAGLR